MKKNSYQLERVLKIKQESRQQQRWNASLLQFLIDNNYKHRKRIILKGLIDSDWLLSDFRENFFKYFYSRPSEGRKIFASENYMTQCLN